MGVTESPRGHAGVVNPPHQNIQFSELFYFESIVDRFLDGCWFPYELHFWWFSVFCASLFRAWILHCFCIDLGMICRIILDVFLIPFPFAYTSYETFNTIVFTMDLYDFTIQENMNFDNFNSFFATNFGIDFWWVWASILVSCLHPFGIKFHVWGWSLLGIIFDVICW